MKLQMRRVLDSRKLVVEKIKIADAIDASNNALPDANEQLEKAEAMTKRPISSYLELSQCV